MKKKVMLEWTKALRSGKYKQTKGVLKAGDAFCCPGVLCKISKLGRFVNGRYLGEIGSLPDEVLDFAGMKTRRGVREMGESLIQLNDANGGLTFGQIADIIEKEYKDL